MIFVVKLTLVPLLILGITAAGRRWGPSVAGWLSAFPVVAGPILFFMTLEQGSSFGAEAAVSMLLTIVAHLCFGVAYAWAACRQSWPVSLAVALGVYAVAVALLNAVHLGLPGSTALVIALLGIAGYGYPKATLQRAPAPPQNVRVDLLLRMVAGAVLVVAVSWAAGSLGARLAGLLAMFPVLGVVLAVFSHRQAGAGFTVALLRNMVRGYYAFGAFCITVAVGLPAWGVPTSFAWATVVALAVQWTTRRRLA